jgi:hypothetical protein
MDNYFEHWSNDVQVYSTELAIYQEGQQEILPQIFFFPYILAPYY